jgi:hypothetical protein
MSKSVGRNDPCPCGSGKKFKKCCALKEQEVVRERVLTQRGYEQFDETIVELGRWLSLDHPRAIDEMSRVIFRALYDENEAEAMPDRIEAHEQTDAVTWNSLDAAVAYWAPTQVQHPTFADLDACDESVRTQLVGGEVARLDEVQQSCARDLLASPMRLFEVKQYEPNQTLVLTDVASAAEVTYPYPTASFNQDDLFATRVVEREGGGRCMMGYLPITEDHRAAAREAVQTYDAGKKGELGSAAESTARRTLFLALWRLWLAPFAAGAPGLASESEAAPATAGAAAGEA